MTVLRAEVTWCVAIDIFRIDVRSVLYKRLNDAQITSQTGNVKWCPEIVCPCIDYRAELNEDVNQGCVPLVSRQMQWRKPIRINTIYNLIHFIFLIELLLGVTKHFKDLIIVSLINLRPVVHLHLFDVLLSLPLFATLLRVLASIHLAVGVTSRALTVAAGLAIGGLGLVLLLILIL